MSSRMVRRDPAFAQRLREEMVKRGVKPGQLAKMLEVRAGTVSRWRNGECPDDWRFPAIAGALGVGVEWLKTGVGERVPEAQSPVPDELTELRDKARRLAYVRDVIRAQIALGLPPSPAIMAELLRLAAGEGGPGG